MIQEKYISDNIITIQHYCNLFITFVSKLMMRFVRCCLRKPQNHGIKFLSFHLPYNNNILSRYGMLWHHCPFHVGF